MRPALALTLLLVLAPLAGCVGGLLDRAGTAPVELVLDEVPAGARVEAIPGGLRLVWEAVPLPLEEDVRIPAGTTLVSLTAEVGATQGVSVYMRHAETERRRCNVPFLEAWDAPLLGRATCSGLTVVDDLPDSWTMRVAGRGGVASAELVTVDLRAAPLDGLVAGLDLSELSRREFALRETEVLDVPSFDGERLRVEVTLPEGDGPWPTILWSSPYNHADRLSGKPAAWSYFARDWAERGYAVVSADVRGFGESGGCVEVWGPNEQKDQVFLVEWVASQDWSDGRVGFYGQSYVATTPVEAAVHAPDALKAIVIVAPVNNAYDDWHFGGVPNGENVGSPAGYYATGAQAGRDPNDPARSVVNAGNGFCDPSVATRANDPRGVYDAFYEERNFSARAKDIRAAVLYTQGFEDSNVKSQMIPDFFNAVTAPKLGLFGHWVHQHPTRADNEVLMLGWMDQYVKGRPVGFERLPSVAVVTNAGTERVADAWPPLDAPRVTLHADLAGGALADAPADGSASLLLLPAGAPAALPAPGVLVALDGEPLAAPLHVAGQMVVRVKGTLEGATNAHVAAHLYETTDEGTRLVTWGMFNLAHRFGHDRHEPVMPGETFTVGVPLLPTEWVFAPGATLHLELRAAHVRDWFAVAPTAPGRLVLEGGEDGTALVLPTVDGVAGVRPLPVAAMR